MAIKNVEIQDSRGNVYYPHTDASVVKYGNKTVAEQLSEKAKQVDLDITNANLAQLSNSNLLINGDFQIWQRGTTSGNWAFSADMWYLAGDTNSKSEKTDKGIKITVQQTGTWTNFFQVLERDLFKKMIGKYLTLTFKTTTPTDKVAQVWAYDRGNSHYYANGMFNDGKMRDTFSITILLNDVVGNVEFGIQVLSTIGSSIEIEWAKLEVGSKLTPFIPKTYTEELISCKRYYQVVKISGIAYSNTLLPLCINFPVTMRIAPTVQISVTAGNGDSTMDSFGSGAINIQGYTLNNVTQDGIFYLVNQTGNFVAGKTYDAYATLHAEV